MIRVFVADDHAIVRAGIKQVLAEEPDIQVVGEADNGSELLRALRDNHFAVLVLDMSMPGRSGVELIKQLKRERPRLRVLVLSMHDEAQYAVRAIKAGAQGYLTKTSAPTELVGALRKVAGGGVYFGPEVAERLALSFSTPRDESPPHLRLSDREHQIYLRLAQGATVTEIAEELCLSSKTVSTHKARILQKLGAANLAELIRYAVRQGLVDHGDASDG